MYDLSDPLCALSSQQQRLAIACKGWLVAFDFERPPNAAAAPQIRKGEINLA